MERDRFVGCLLGQCLGDALGFPVEGAPPGVCADYVREVLRGGRAGTLGRGGFAFGQYTDDSQLARELLESLVERGGWEPEDYGRRIGAIFGEGRIVGRGQATTNAARRLRRGTPWREAGEPAPSAGNGSAMRAAPVGLVFHRRPELARIAREQGSMTHADPRCGDGAVAIAAGVSAALDDVVRPEAFSARVGAVMTTEAFREALARLPGLVELAPEEAYPIIRDAGLPEGFRHDWHGISPFVVGSVMWSLYAFLRHPDDWWEAICVAIAVGGDVDTTAAMTGALGGARVGRDGLPADLVAQLNDQGTWAEDALTELAERAFTLARELPDSRSA